jgi:hypothetical protein
MQTRCVNCAMSGKSQSGPRLNGCRNLHHARIVTDSGDGSDIPNREVTARRQEPMQWEAEDNDAFAKAHAST